MGVRRIGLTPICAGFEILTELTAHQLTQAGSKKMENRIVTNERISPTDLIRIFLSPMKLMLRGFIMLVGAILLAKAFVVFLGNG